MKRLLSLTIMALFVGMSTGAQSAGGHGPVDAVIRDRFLGAWRLASLEEPDANGNVHKADCIGMLVYTRDGYMSVQVMYRNATGGGQGGPVQYAQGGYEASFGRYEINDSHTFTFHVEGAMVRGLIGNDLLRVYEFRGKQMIVKSSDPNEHWRVVWERY